MLWWNVIKFLFRVWVYVSSTVAFRNAVCLVPIWLSVKMKCDFVLCRRMMKDFFLEKTNKRFDLKKTLGTG